MRNRKGKIIISIILAILVMLCVSHVALAEDNFNFDRFNDQHNNDVDKAAKNIMGTAVSVIRIVGTGVSIIMLTVIAIKYMTSAPNEKADLKKSAGIFVVGAILVFASTNILAIIVNFSSNITS